MAEKSKNPHERHRERIRETFRKTGIENMPEHSVLELLLFYSVPRKDTNELAHRLIDTFGSLSRVLDAPYERLMEVDASVTAPHCCSRAFPPSAAVISRIRRAKSSRLPSLRT